MLQVLARVSHAGERPDALAASIVELRDATVEPVSLDTVERVSADSGLRDGALPPPSERTDAYIRAKLDKCEAIGDNAFARSVRGQ